MEVVAWGSEYVMVFSSLTCCKGLYKELTYEGEGKKVDIKDAVDIFGDEMSPGIHFGMVPVDAIASSATVAWTSFDSSSCTFSSKCLNPERRLSFNDDKDELRW